jgi:hypothetical protein
MSITTSNCDLANVTTPGQIRAPLPCVTSRRVVREPQARSIPEHTPLARNLAGACKYAVHRGCLPKGVDIREGA